MTTDDQECSETPRERVTALTDDQCRAALLDVLTAILASKDTRAVPDILHEHRLLAQFEVYDADNAWDEAVESGRREILREID